jgi:hypothetical protein
VRHVEIEVPCLRHYAKLGLKLLHDACHDIELAINVFNKKKNVDIAHVFSDRSQGLIDHTLYNKSQEGSDKRFKGGIAAIRI